MQDLAPRNGPEVWHGKSLTPGGDWLLRLNEAQLAEVFAAASASQIEGQPIERITRANFDLPLLRRSLAQLDQEIRDGRGFAVIRGLPVTEWSKELLARAFWGIGCYFGEAVSQNAAGHLLGHVIDLRGQRDRSQRIYQTNQAQPFHSDSCDIVGLLCLRKANSGGASAVASSAAIHNRLLESNPEALRTLYGRFVCDRYNEVPEGKAPYYEVHIFNRYGPYLTCCGMDPDIRSAQRLDVVARLTPAQLEALDAFQEAATEVAFHMVLEPGDIQLVHNHTVVHARSAFVDAPKPDQRRYLLRLWLSSSRGRPLPIELAERWGTIEVGAKRGGIVVPGVSPAVCLSPVG